MDRFERLFGAWVVRNRWWVIAITVLVLVVSASGMRYITTSNDLRIFFSEENPQLQALEALENTYNKSENVFIVLAPKDGDAFTNHALKAVQELTKTAWEIPYSSRVDSVTNFQHTRVEGDELIVEDLVTDADIFSGAQLKEARDVALNEPLLLNRLISASASVTGVNINIVKQGSSQEEVPEVANFVYDMVEGFRERYDDIDFYVTGSVIYDYTLGEVGMSDIATLVPMMLTLLLIILGVLLRSALGTVATFVVIMISTITGIGLAGWLGIELNVSSMNAPTIILTLAVADSVHILTSMLQFMRKGKGRREAVAEALRINLQPVFLTSLTTAIGFLSMNFSDAPPFRDLGNVVALGITAALLYSVFFLPAFLSVLPIGARAREHQAGAAGSLLDSFSNGLIRNRRKVLWATVAAVLLLTAGTAKIDLNDNFYDYFEDSYAITRASDFTQDNLTSLEIIDYSLDSGAPGGISEPAYLDKVDEFVRWLRAQPEVVHVSTITDTMKRLNRNMHADDEAYYRIPDSRELAAQYLLLYELSLPFGLDLNNQIDVDKSATKVSVATSAREAKAKRELDRRVQEWLKANAPESMWTSGSGISMIFAYLSGRNINSMLGASFGALLLISALLAIVFRSLKLGLVSLVPNLAPAFMAFGIWGLVAGQVGLALSLLVSLTLGIVVDYSIHFMSKYLRANGELGLSPEGSVRYSFGTVGAALVVSTLVLVAGFSVLAFSGFKPNSDIGLMTAVTITIALVLDFLFLPAVLLEMHEKTSIKESRNEKVHIYGSASGLGPVSADSRSCCTGAFATEEGPSDSN